MILPAVPDRALAELGRTEGGPDTLALLVRDQDTRRLLMLRAVLDAVDGAATALCPAAARRRVAEDWALLAEADRAGPREGDGPRPHGGTTGGTGGGAGVGAGAGGGQFHAPGPADLPGGPADTRRRSPARARLLHPLVGPWATRCLRGLDTETEPPTRERTWELRRDLAHLSALAAAAAARAGISFTVRLTARDGALTLPSLGALHTVESGDAPVEVRHRRGHLTLRQRGGADVVVHLEDGIGAWSGAPSWTPAYALPGLVPGSAPMPLDDTDPYRTVPGGPRYREMSPAATPDDGERKRWVQAWMGTAGALLLGGEQRVMETAGLLRCLVPLAAPPASPAGSDGGGYCSATRREAFGAVLSSPPPTPPAFAATLVHEIQHTKLAALAQMVTLHHASPDERYFAPWRPDPRPYDGLLQGTYSHLALADYFQRCARAAPGRTEQESAWALYARYKEQVGAALPTLVASADLTDRGRAFVDQMVATYERIAAFPAPRGHAARAAAYVKAARTLWLQRHGPLRRTRE
ncbi:HEXXH motif-containing putative peptide modification protein [Streptomyces caeni]|uniref:HEXXH motif-containing putative peptide modification protein n=1 Tax=Streptomyces caeni TaxID=2307231 RepID=A0ABW4ILW1_9ACTN